MFWLAEVGLNSGEQMLPRLHAKLVKHAESVAATLGMGVDADDGKGMVTLADAEGISLFLWFEDMIEGGLGLHYSAPVCVVPEGRHAYFSGLLFEAGGFLSLRKFVLVDDLASLVGCLPLVEVTDSLVTHVMSEMVVSAQKMAESLVHLHGALPWNEAWGMRAAELWALTPPEEGADILERSRRHTFDVMRRREVSARFMAAALDLARGHWLDTEDAGRQNWKQILRGRLTTLLIDLDKACTFNVGQDAEGDMVLQREGFALTTGFITRRQGGSFLYCFTVVCQMTDKNRQAVYEALLKDGASPRSVKSYVLEDQVGVSGFLSVRQLTDSTARELFLETFDHAVSLHDMLTQTHGLPSLRGKDFPPSDAR